MEGILESWFNLISCSLEVNFLIDQLSDHFYHTAHFRSATYFKLTLFHPLQSTIYYYNRTIFLAWYIPEIFLPWNIHEIAPTKAQGISLLYSIAAGIVISILFVFWPVSYAVMVYTKKNICYKKNLLFLKSKRYVFRVFIVLKRGTCLPSAFFDSRPSAEYTIVYIRIL